MNTTSRGHAAGASTDQTCAHASAHASSSQPPHAAARQLRAFLQTQNRPIRLEDAQRRCGWKGPERGFLDAAKNLGREKAGLLHRGLLFPPALLEFVQATLAHEPNGRIWALLADGRRLPVPLRATKLVLGGDVVEAALIRPKTEDRDPDAVPVAIKQRTNPRFWGRVVRGEGGVLCVSAERRVEALELELDGASSNAREGDIVLAETDARGFLGRKTKARAIETIGRAEDAGIESELARRLWGLPGGFAPEALAEAARLHAPETPESGRVDWRALPFVTIDGSFSRDYDDAVQAAAQGENILLRVAIADVSAFVRKGSPVDQAARERLTSVYLPQRTWPMLPEALSNGLCSLNPGEDRLALGCEMTVAPNGDVASYRFTKALIRSQARLTYEAVSAFLDAGTPLDAPEAAADSVRALGRAAEALGRAAKSRRLDMHQDALRPALGPDSKVERIEVEPRGSAHKLVEECMLAANLSAARFLMDSGYRGVFRNQPAPAAEKAAALAEALAAFDIDLAVDPDGFRSSLSSALDRARALKNYPIIRGEILRVMQQASYEPMSAGHFSLGEAAYAHFTSPIRRYPDLMAHRLIKAALEGRDPAQEHDPADLEALCAACTQRSKAASGAETESRKLLYADYARRLVRDASLDGTARADSMSDRGMFVLLEETLLEAYIPGKILEDAGWESVGDGPAWRMPSGRVIEPGDQFCAVLAGAEPSSRRISILPAATPKSRAA